jgi:hypothetical protein
MAQNFEGWYFKQQGRDGVVALIPAFHPGDGRSPASLQVVTNDLSFSVPFAGGTVHRTGAVPEIELGGCRFSARGLSLDLNGGALEARGELRFGALTPPGYDVMGPFRFVPFLECRHSLFSLTHPVSGSLEIEGKTFDFSGGTGYIEGDRGRAFPSSYVWTQCCWREGGDCSLMLSAAEIPLLGRSFTGVTGVVLLRGRQYRLATFLGARASVLGGDFLEVRQGKYRFRARCLDSAALILRAPSPDGMTRRIRENPACRVHYRLTEGADVLLDFTASSAGFESEI